uniref:BZIP domain-containing protein n=1 Tax=Zea mays TaxID=4577 RepID=A0A804NZR3_MAIZE
MNMDKTPIAGDGGGDAGGGGGGSGNGPEMQSSLDAVAPSPTPHTELDISSMPDTPLRKPGHRRALSEIIGLPDDLDLGGPGAGDAPALSDENEEELFSMFLDVDKLNSRCGASESEPSCAMAGGPGEATETSAAASGAAQGQMHHHNRHSMDASSSIDAEHLFGTTVTEGVSPAEAKKAMSAANLAELALIDPKKAKRIINNRQSAARSKERKMRYIAELERKVQFMQREATALATQLALLQRDTAGLTVENGDLKIRLESTEQQIHLQDAAEDGDRAGGQPDDELRRTAAHVRRCEPAGLPPPGPSSAAIPGGDATAAAVAAAAHEPAVAPSAEPAAASGGDAQHRHGRAAGGSTWPVAMGW